VRVLVSSNPNLGHFLPLVPLAQRLQQRGHDVVVATEPAFAVAVQSHGLEQVTVGRDLTTDDMMAVLPEIFEIAPEEQNAYAVPRLFVELRAHNAADGLLAMMAQWQPDLVIREPAEFASWAIAERLGIPHVTVGVGMATSAQEWDTLVGPWFAGLGDRVGIDDLDASSLFRYRLLSFAPAGYHDWTHTPSARVFRPEPVAATAPLDPRIHELDDRPLVYATLGTEFYDAPLMSSMISAATDNDCNVVATTGHQGDPAEVDPLSPSVVVSSWIAQDALLERTAVVICHAGAGSTGGPLVRGVPLVVVPRGADQFLHAQRVEELGVGIMLRSRQQSEDDIRTALGTVLQNPHFRDAAQRMARATARLPDTDRAVDELEQLIADGQ
jgi:UDP:flavonoid glycosyltransferase YjiC (YdhE family)